VEVDDWMMRPLVEEFEVRMWNDPIGVLVLTAILLIDEVANISVPEMIHLKGSPPLPPVEVEYLLFCPSRRLPETIIYPDNVSLVPEALVNRKAVIVVEAERRSSAVRDPFRLEIVDETERKEDDVSPVI